MTTIRPTSWTNGNLADAVDAIAIGVGTSYGEENRKALLTEAARRLRTQQPEPLTEASREFGLAMVRLVARLKEEGAL